MPRMGGQLCNASMEPPKSFAVCADGEKRDGVYFLGFLFHPSRGRAVKPPSVFTYRGLPSAGPAGADLPASVSEGETPKRRLYIREKVNASA